MPRPNWSRPLPRPLVIPGVMFSTLADVREPMRHLPDAHRRSYLARKDGAGNQPSRMYMREETQSVTAPYLLEGAAYALEQCGLLLRDANLLY